MELGSIFMLLAVVLLVGIYVSSPLFSRSSAREKPEDTPSKVDENAFIPVQAASQDHTRSSLLADYDRLLNSLQELEFDHALGKIPVEDYPTQRALLMASGAEVLQKLDAMKAAPPVVNAEEVVFPTSSKTAEERFTAAVQAKLAADSGAPPRFMPAGLPAEEAGAVVAKATPSFPSSNGTDHTREAVPPAATGQLDEGRGAPVGMSDADLELIITARRQARHEKPSGFCPKCGKPVQKSDRFCPKCGKAL